MRAARTRVGLWLLGVACLSAICSHATATVVTNVADMALTNDCKLREHSWAVLSSSQIPHTTLVRRHIKSSYEILLLLKYCLTAQSLFVERCQLAQVAWICSFRALVPDELIVLPGIPPPTAHA